jgi:cob(I)alamin adenosyltransferase
MADRATCYRHSRSVWVASCPDCTDWHLARLAARRAERTDERDPADENQIGVVA